MPNLPSDSIHAQVRGIKKTCCTGLAASTRFYHTHNSNYLDQNIGLNKPKLSLLVNNNTAECKASQEKANISQNYPR